MSRARACVASSSVRSSTKAKRPWESRLTFTTAGGSPAVGAKEGGGARSPGKAVGEEVGRKGGRKGARGGWEGAPGLRRVARAELNRSVRIWADTTPMVRLPTYT